MAKLISAAHRVSYTEKRHEFSYIGETEACFSFGVGKDGKEIFPSEEAEKNFRKCIAHPEAYTDHGIVEIPIFAMEYAKAICECGEEIEIPGFYYGASECPNCGRWHNTSGQLLLPPDQWEGMDEDE